MWLYSTLLLASFAVPFLASFDSNLKLHKRWNVIFPSIFVVAVFYIIADIYLTKLGVWGFNPNYHSGVLWFGLPIEEWLFFVVVPYASLFIHYTFQYYFPKIRLGKVQGRILTITLLILASTVMLWNLDKMYTLYISITLWIALGFTFFDKSDAVNQFYLSFLIICIPFLVVNGILTGSLIDKEVVWYNPSENLGIRVLTIPIEDFAYGFSLILFNILLIERLSSNKATNTKTKE